MKPIHDYLSSLQAHRAPLSIGDYRICLTLRSPWGRGMMYESKDLCSMLTQCCLWVLSFLRVSEWLSRFLQAAVPEKQVLLWASEDISSTAKFLLLIAAGSSSG